MLRHVDGFVMQSEFHMRSHRKYEMLDITRQVAEVVGKAGLAEAICSVYVTHATAAIVINENDDPNVCEDVLEALNKLIPEGIWRHDRVDNNAAAHIKSAILGPGKRFRCVTASWCSEPGRPSCSPSSMARAIAASW